MIESDGIEVSREVATSSWVTSMTRRTAWEMRSSVFLPRWPDGLKIHAAYNQIIHRCAAKRESVHLVPIHATFLGHGSHCLQFWRAHYRRDDPHYWYDSNVEDPNDRGYDASSSNISAGDVASVELRNWNEIYHGRTFQPNDVIAALVAVVTGPIALRIAHDLAARSMVAMSTGTVVATFGALASLLVLRLRGGMQRKVSQDT